MGIATLDQVRAKALKAPHVLAPTDLKIGDCVVFTNDYGVIFEDLHVIGFADPEKNSGRSVYLDYDCYWFPAKVSSLTKKENFK